MTQPNSVGLFDKYTSKADFREPKKGETRPKALYTQPDERSFNNVLRIVENRFPNDGGVSLKQMQGIAADYAELAEDAPQNFGALSRTAGYLEKNFDALDALDGKPDGRMSKPGLEAAVQQGLLTPPTR